MEWVLKLGLGNVVRIQKVWGRGGRYGYDSLNHRRPENLGMTVLGIVTPAIVSKCRANAFAVVHDVC